MVGVRQALAVAATSAYGAVLQADASRQAAIAALEAADADFKRTSDRRDAGVVTDADVLAVEVHRAAVEEGRLRASLAADLARADLNRAMGEPLDAQFTLAPLTPSTVDAPAPVTTLEAEALSQRPELQQARLAVDLAGLRSARPGPDPCRRSSRRAAGKATAEPGATAPAVGAWPPASASTSFAGLRTRHG